MQSNKWCRRILEIAVAAAVLSGGGSALADEKYSATFDVAKDGTAVTCKATPAKIQKPATGGYTFLVRVDKDKPIAIENWTIGATQKKAEAAKQNEYLIKLDAVAVSDKIELTLKATGEAQPVKCDAVTIENAGETKPTPPQQQSTIDPADTIGALWWQKYGRKHLDALVTDGRSKGLPDDAEALVHLPSGAPAFPYASSVREGTPLQVYAVVPVGDAHPITITVTSCPDVQTFRVKPTKAEAQSAAALSPDTLKETDFMLVPVGASFKCGAGTANYKLAVGDGDTVRTTTASVRLRAVHHLAASFVLGFDLASRSSFGKKTVGTATQIEERSDRVGLAAYVGAVWMVGGVDYERMRWYNYFLNPFIAVNPVAPTKDAVFGLAITPTGGVSLAMAISFHKRTELTGGYAANSPFSGDGDPPTHDTWSGFRPSLFLGAAIDSNIYDVIKGVAAK